MHFHSNRRLLEVIATSYLITLLASCASVSDRESGGAAPQNTGTGAQTSSDSSVEEIVVSASRLGRTRGAPRTRSRQNTAPRAAAQPSALAQEGNPVEPPDRLLERAFGSTEAGSARLGRLRGRPTPLSVAEAGEELWVIALAHEEPPAEPHGDAEDDAPGSGALLATVPNPAQGEPTTVPLPLKHTDVHAQITGYISSVDVTQEFENPYDEKIEAVYMFPLPAKGAVREFVMTIGERRIRGILREKEEAEQIYRDARAQGYRASLLVQHRPNVFEQKVANIEPGKRIDVDIRYFHTLAYHDGWYSFVFPTVVGPRYNPNGFRDPIAALPRGHVAESSRGTAVRYLRPEERSAHDISIRVEVDAGVPLEEIVASHEVNIERPSAESAAVELAAGSTIPNRDFILDFRVAGETMKSNLLTFTDPETRQGYFTLMLYPPAGLDALARRPVEMVFVLDTSGSMDGRPLTQAKEAVRSALDRLTPDDTFQILRFSNSVSRFGPSPMRATAENLKKARDYLKALDADGGTEMLAGVRAALGFPHDPGRLRFVTFLTDGFIGNEAQIIGEVHRSIGAARIFSFGVGNSVNRYLLEGMADAGRGAVAYLGLDDSADDVMRYFFDRISHPALTDLEIDWGEMQAGDVYPSRLPDLFVGRPVILTGKFRGEPGEVTIKGAAAETPIAFSIAPAARSPGRAALAPLWARLKIADLADRQTEFDDANGELALAIRRTALEYGLMSQYTSFVAVDASERTAADHGTTVHQAVPVPDGVRYETTIAERDLQP